MRRALLVCALLLMTAFSLLASLNAQPSKRVSADIYAERRKSLTGKTYYVVIINYEDVHRIAVEVRASAGGKTIEQRADEIVNRMRELQKRDPNWAEKTYPRVDHRSGQWVVAASKDPHSAVLATADQNSVRPMNCKSTQQLAQTIHQMVRNTYHFIALPGKFRGEKMRSESLPQDWVTQGDTCLEKYDIPGAIDSYQKALGLSPHYAYAELRLASIYLDLPGKRGNARTLLADAAKQSLDAEEQQTLKTLQKKLAQ